MKEIGESFRLAREKIGLSKEETIKDLKITISQLENLEDGNANAFKDVFFLKDLIKKYSIYLNLDEDAMINAFNDFIFSYTSRIPVEDILEQTKEINMIEKKQNPEKVISPYTKIEKEKDYKYILLYASGIILFIILIVLIVVFVANKRWMKWMFQIK